MTNHEYQNQCATRALQDILAGRVPSEADLATLTGELKGCVTALLSNLQEAGEDAARAGFKALLVDRDWLGKLASSPKTTRTPDYNLYHLYQMLITGEAPPSIPLSSYGLFADWQDIATEMYQAWTQSGADGVTSYIKGFNNLKQKSDLEKRLIRLLCGESPASAVDDEQKQEPWFHFLDDDEFENRPQREWLIPKIIPRSGITLVYGLPRCGKSFLTIAWSLCIATGTRWLGRNVQQGRVAYIVAEGGAGLGPRLKAWKAHNGYQGRSGVRWLDKSLILHDPGHFAKLIMGLKMSFEEPPAMIVIDTFSRCSGGADENNASEIAKFLAAADALQQEFQCAVLIVHHEGKDGQRGPRGSSAFMGNTETVIGVASTSEGCQVTCSKQKDSKEFAPISLQMVAVRYGVNEEDESLVLTLGQEPAPSITFSAETTMYNVLLTAPERTLTYSKWVEAGMDKSLGSARIESKRTAEDAISTLKRSGRVHQEKKGAPYSIPLDAIPQQEVPPQEVPDIA